LCHQPYLCLSLSRIIALSSASLSLVLLASPLPLSHLCHLPLLSLSHLHSRPLLCLTLTRVITLSSDSLSLASSPSPLTHSHLHCHPLLSLSHLRHQNKNHILSCIGEMIRSSDLISCMHDMILFLAGLSGHDLHVSIKARAKKNHNCWLWLLISI